MASPEQPPLPLLFLIGDTGGGHRSAATAVAQALEGLLAGRVPPVIGDPLRGPGAPRLVRWVSGLYGPCIRLTPWLWWLFWRTSNSPQGLGLLRRTIMAPVYRRVTAGGGGWRRAGGRVFPPRDDRGVPPDDRRPGRAGAQDYRRPCPGDHRRHRPGHRAP